MAARLKEQVSALEALATSRARAGQVIRALVACKALLELDPRHPLPHKLLSESAASPVPLFSALDGEALAAVLEVVRVRSFVLGQPVVREGEAGSSMFAVAEGRLEVLRLQDDGAHLKVAELGPGEFFGELAVAAAAPRLATVNAIAVCVLLELPRAEMEALIRRLPRVGEVLRAFYRDRLLANVMRSNPLFASLPEALKAEVAQAFVVKTAAAGEHLLRYGAPGDGLYVLLRGRCLPFLPRPGGGETKYPEMREGDVFGEISLLLGKPITASVRAVTPCAVLWLSRADFDALIRAHPAFRSELVQMGFARLQRSAQLMSHRFGHRSDSLV